jgi:alpha-methylacyl-CoA racemase
MVDGASSLMTMFYAFRQAGNWTDERGSNVLDSGAPYYDVYETKDGKYVSIGAIEAKFYRELLERLGLAGEQLPGQNDRAGWPKIRQRFAEVFRTKTREEWAKLLEGTDVCFAPVLDLTEAQRHPHNLARSVFVEQEGVMQPAPAPRFSRTPGALRRSPPERGQHNAEALAEWGVKP